jgi:hypothetical protein
MGQGYAVRDGLECAIIRDLYAVVSRVREAGLDAVGRRELRPRESVPRMAKLHTTILGIRQRVLSKSAVGEACDYALGQWPRLELFLTDGRLEADNTMWTGGNRWVLGSNSGGSAYFCKGRLDDVAIWHEALSAARTASSSSRPEPRCNPADGCGLLGVATMEQTENAERRIPSRRGFRVIRGEP